MMNIGEEARGRWRSLLPILGVDTRFLTGRHGPCPICEGKDRWRFDDKDGKGTWFCNQCGAGDGIGLVMKLKGWDFKQTASELKQLIPGAERTLDTRRNREDKSVKGRLNRLWQDGVAIDRGNLVGRYLEQRGLVLDEYPAALRMVQKCWYDKNASYPAMIAKVVGPDNAPLTIHRTYLDEHEADKAQVEAPRKLMGGAKITPGAAIRLAKPNGSLGVAEGIETALSAQALFQVPVWATISARMLMAWEPPEGIGEIVVFIDRDQSFTGQSHGYALAHRLAVAGHKVRVEIPNMLGDWNDELLARIDRGDWNG